MTLGLMFLFMGFFIPKNPPTKHNEYHGHTHPCPLTPRFTSLLCSTVVGKIDRCWRAPMNGQKLNRVFFRYHCFETHKVEVSIAVKNLLLSSNSYRSYMINSHESI